MDSELVLLVVYVEIADNKQIDVSAECADKGGETNIFDSEVFTRTPECILIKFN